LGKRRKTIDDGDTPGLTKDLNASPESGLPFSIKLKMSKPHWPVIETDDI
jgi:hypothetical protein